MAETLETGRDPMSEATLAPDTTTAPDTPTGANS